MNASDRALVLLVLVPQVAAFLAFVLAAATGAFVGPALLAISFVGALLVQLPGQTPNPSLDPGPRWPWPLLALVALYFLLKFDLSHYHLMGVNGPATHALGVGLGLGSPDPASNQVLGFIPVVPEGHVVLATAAQVAGTLGARLLFAWVFVGLALVGWRLAREVLPDRPRLAVAMGALCVFNPGAMEAWGLDSLGNVLPALALGLTLLLSALPARAITLGFAAGVAVCMRPTLALGVIPMLALMTSRAPARGARLVLGLALPLGLLTLWRLASGQPMALDPGLTPLGPGALAISDAIWWWDPTVRAPWSDGPAWAVAATGLLGRMGTVGAVLLLIGLGRSRRLGSLATWLTVATLPPLVVFLLRGPAMSGEQHDRLLVFVVPGAVLLGLGLERIAIAWRAAGRARLAWTTGVLIVSTVLVAAGNGLRDTPFPVEHAAHRSFSRLLPQSDTAARPEPSGPLWWFPGYTLQHLLDPIVDQGGQRWRDLAWNLAHPRLRQRPMSIDERALSRTKGPQFDGRWLPNHPLAALPVTRGPGPDPYGEATPLLIEIDLRDAVTEGRVSLRVVDGGEVHADLAGSAGPIRLDTVRLGPDQPVVDVTLWKEYRSRTDAESAIVVMPRWDRVAWPDARLMDSTLRVRVPANGFLSLVVVLGERVDAMALIAALEWNVGLRPGGVLEVFGPFRL